MGWRTFSTLLRGLGPNSALTAHVAARSDNRGIGKREDVYVVDGGPEETVAVFSARLGLPAPPPKPS